MNLREAIDLLEVISDFRFKPAEEKADFCIVDDSKKGYHLCVKASRISDEYRAYIKKIVAKRGLDLRESEGIITIQRS